MWRGVVPAGLVLFSLCAWGQSATDAKQAPDAPQPQANAPAPPPAHQDQDQTENKDSWLHKRFGQGCLAGMACWGQDQGKKPDEPSQQPLRLPPNEPPPRSTVPRGPGDSSSKDTGSSRPADEAADTSDVTEVQVWDPHRAAKDIEVGDFNLKQQRYAAALSRYCEALQYKPGDATATFRIGQTLEKAGDLANAQTYYETYLKILPSGPFAAQARKQLERLQSLPERPNKHLAERQGCEAPGKPVRARKEPLDPDRPVLTRNPTSPPERKSP